MSLNYFMYNRNLEIFYIFTSEQDKRIAFHAHHLSFHFTFELFVYKTENIILSS